MSLRARFTNDLKTAMLAKEPLKVATIRLMNAGLKDKDIEARGKGNMDGLGDAEIIAMLEKMVKQRRESIEQYQKGNRPELAAQEQAEIDVIEGYLPQQMTEDEAKVAVAGLVSELGVTSIRDMGKVMNELKARYAGRMDFAKAGGFVKEKLSA